MAKPDQEIHLIITMNAEGQVSVRGPLSNKMLCYGLLGCARDVIANHEKKEEKQPLLVPSHNIVKPH